MIPWTGIAIFVGALILAEAYSQVRERTVTRLKAIEARLTDMWNLQTVMAKALAHVVEIGAGGTAEMTEYLAVIDAMISSLPDDIVEMQRRKGA